MIASSTFTCMLHHQHTLQAYNIMVYEIDKVLQTTASKDDDDNDKEEVKIWELVPSEYYEYLLLFKKLSADVLPLYQKYDHKIPLKERFTPSFSHLYSLSKPELQALHEWINENLSKGFIQASLSPAGVPILFTKKKDKLLRLCVNYWELNESTIKNCYPLPLIHETLLQLSKA